ncbi:hypothetical protein [Sphingobium sp. BS19]|uniref:hypothetical protein n=1 Tax=Sphingobium sp. BS19 TaxID=3018973 RepID=UPI0022EF50CB|nr:hypothetical protein [Sphingobium sp. BS19]GLI99169.1 hypothetical protein Sbs19_29870 [Sphingobium sp. BS19]
MPPSGTRKRILARLQHGDWVTGRELHKVAAPSGSLANIRVQIQALREQGYDIEGDHVGPKSKGYRLSQ